jgi:hypothetical protein
MSSIPPCSTDTLLPSLTARNTLYHDIINDEEEYKVEEICGHRKQGHGIGVL